MTFAALIEYSEDKNKITEVRPEHRVYLASLRESGKLVIAGPFRDGSGGFIVYDVAAEADVEALIRNDPFFQRGVFVKWSIYPWTPVMSNHAKIPELPPA